MDYRRFTFATLGLALGLGLAAAAANWAVDPYGLFHDRGRSRIAYFDERTSKYLLAERYIPEQFDALLLGTSVSLNWDTSRLAGLALYNGSLDGGNVTEARLLLDQVLRRRRPRVLVMVIYPFLTASHGRQSAGMVERDVWGALGSHALLFTYAYMGAVRLGLKPAANNPYGWRGFESPARPEGAPLDPKEEAEKFVLDEQAVAEYRDLLDTARRQGVPVVGVIPPVDPAFWKFERPAFEAYHRRMLPLFRPDEPIVDFNAPEYEAFRAGGRFPDGVHADRATAEQLVGLLQVRLRSLGFCGA